MFEHDLRANASRLSRGKTGTHPRIKSESMLFRIMLQAFLPRREIAHLGDARFEPGLTQVRQNHGPCRQRPAWMCRFRDVGARFSDVPSHIVVRADAYPGVTRMVVERHVRLNSPQCEPFQYEPHRHERRPQIAAAFLLHRILVQTAERVDQDHNRKRDTDQPQQQITSHESASGLRAG